MKTCKRGLHQYDDGDNRCRECALDYKRKIYAHNPEKYRAIGRAWALSNRDKAREKSRVWRAANPEKNRANCKAWAASNLDKIRSRERQRRYDLKPGEWEEMFIAQGSKCAICLATEHGGKYWHTDHCHATGVVRGILCHNCNHMLGGSRDNANNLIAAVVYLNRSKAA